MSDRQSPSNTTHTLIPAVSPPGGPTRSHETRRVFMCLPIGWILISCLGIAREIFAVCYTELPSDSYTVGYPRRPRLTAQLALKFKKVGYPIQSNAPTCAEFFAGIGLMRYGLEAAGWRVTWANDIDATKFDLYDNHFGDASEHFVLDDVHNINPSDIPQVDLATASFPCTDLSLAGGRRGINAGESSAFWGFLDAIDGMPKKPSIILLENVTGFLTSNGGKDFEQAMLALNNLGYSVDPFILNARWFVPQSRQRLFVVGTRQSDNFEGVSISDSRIRPQAITRFVNEHPNISWSIAELPDPPKASQLQLSDILEDLPNGSSDWWSKDRVDYLHNQMSPKHREQIDSLIKKRSYSYGTVFRRVRKQPDGSKRSMAELRLDGVAGCLRTPKGGSGRQILVKAGYGTLRVRLLTPQECARLMGADDFEISGTLNQALFGFGDAVCATAVEWIARNYLTPSLNHHYP